MNNALLSFLILQACLNPLLAADIEVTTTADSGPGSLREAVSLATDADTVTFSPTLNNATITLTSGEIVIDSKSPRIQGSSTITLTTDGTSRLFRLIDSDSTLFSLNCSNTAPTQNGAAILIERGEPTLLACRFEENSGASGGAVYSLNSEVIIQNCRFTNNQATISGGAVYCEGGQARFSIGNYLGNSAPSGGALTLSGVAANSRIALVYFSENTATAGDGGAISLRNSSVEIADCEFFRNQASNGGAIAEDSCDNQVSESSFLSNTARNQGGALYSETSSSTYSRCLLRAQQCDGQGGAFLGGSFTGQIQNSIFQSNLSETGGAIVLVDSVVDIGNCTLQGNAASNEAGALFVEDSTLNLINSIIWNNAEDDETNLQSASLAVDGSSLNVVSSLLENWQLQDLPDSNNLDGTDDKNAPHFITPLPPRLAPQLAGGDLRVSEDSPTIDKGSNNPAAEPEDYFGNARSVNAPDLGAIEFLPPLHVNASITGGNNDGTSWSDALRSLQDAFEVAAEGQQIYLAAGTYYPDEQDGNDTDDRLARFQTTQQNLLLGGFPSTGNPLFKDRNPREFETTLSGDIDQNDHTGDQTGNSANVVILQSTTAFDHYNGLTISGGFGDGLTGSAFGGSGFRAASIHSLSMTNCRIEDNYSNSSPVQIFNSTIYPGAAYFERCIFRGNSSDNVRGTLYQLGGDALYLNCLFTGNVTSNTSALYLANEQETQLINCTFQGNRSEGQTGAIFAEPEATLRARNTIVWNNLITGDPSSFTASYFQPIDPGSSFENCLIENWSDTALPGNDNLDGTDPDNDPLFLIPADPSEAPTPSYTDHGYREDSPVINEGENDFNFSELDLYGAPRKVGRIDLGAYEGEVTDLARIWFTDDDQDDSPYGLELALGTNPDVADRDSLRNLRLFIIPDQPQGEAVLSFGNADDAPAGTILKLLRADSLGDNFNEVYRYDEENGSTPAFPTISPTLSPGSIIIADGDPLSENRFYSLEAVYAPE